MTENETIYSFFCLATGKKQMKRMDQMNGLRCVDPDGEQIIFWKIMLGADSHMELTFEVSPFVKFVEWDELLTEASRMKCEDVKDNLEANLKGGELEKKWSLIPAIFGINSRYEPKDRKSAIRFSLLESCGEEIFERILLAIVETLFVQCGNQQASESVKAVMDSFLADLVKEYSFDEELNGCIRNRYDKIENRLKEWFPEQKVYYRNYGRLQNEWKHCIDETQNCNSVIEYYEKVFPNYRKLYYLLCLIQEICTMAGFPCDLPHEFSEENLKHRGGVIPEAVQNVWLLYKEISQIQNLRLRKEIIDEFIDHIHKRHMDWERSVINQLLEKAKMSN